MRKIPAKVIECWGLGLLVGTLSARCLAALRSARRHLAAEKSQRFRPRLLQADSGIAQHLSRDPLLLTQEAEQQVFRSDIGVVQFSGLAHCELEHLLGTRCVREIRTIRRWRLAFLDCLLDFLLDVVEVDVEVCEHGRGHPFPFAYQPQEDVLSPHILVLQARCLLACHLQHLSNAVSEIVAVHL